MFVEKTVGFGVSLFSKAVDLGNRFIVEPVKQLWNKIPQPIRESAPMAAVAAIGGTICEVASHVGTAMAQIADTAADGIVTHASTVIGTVGGIVAATVGFFIIVAIVKWVRSK